jgi:hypothetical protein
MAVPSSLSGVALHDEVLPLSEAQPLQLLEESAESPSLVSLISLTLAWTATKAMRFVVAVSCLPRDAKTLGVYL